MNQEELKAAVLAALLDYETEKKTRRLKAVKKTLRGTVMATLIGSTGLLAAQQERAHTLKTNAAAAMQANRTIAKAKPSAAKNRRQMVYGAVHFGISQYELLTAHQARLSDLAKQLPKDAGLYVIGSTDSIGGYEYNQKLGKQRALAVAKYLKAQGLKITGTTSKVSKAKSANLLARRVDILISTPSALNTAIKMPPMLDQYAASTAGNYSGTATGSGINNNNLANTLIEQHKPKQRQKVGDSAASFRTNASPLESAIAKPRSAVVPDAGVKTGAEAKSDAPINNNKLASLVVEERKPKHVRKINPTATAAGAVVPVSVQTDSKTGAEPKEHRASRVQPATNNRQKVAGVVHFDLNQYVLTAAHKERLDQFIRQLPRDVTLTVVGRTDSDGDPGFNTKLGRQRALTVADHLTGQGIKVDSIATKVSRKSVKGWMARRVDIIISHSATELTIKLPPLVEAKQNAQHQSTPANLRSQNKVKFIAKKLAPVLNRLNNSQTDSYPEQTMQWWEEKSKVNNSGLEKTSWSQ